MKYQFEAPTIKNCEQCPCLRLGEWQAFEKSSCALSSKVHISRSKRPADCPLRKVGKSE